MCIRDRFSIGKDLGLVLAKGILFSLLTVLLLMPSLILRWYRFIAKTQHKPFLPDLGKAAKGIFRLRGVILALVLLTVIPSYTAPVSYTHLF